MPYNRRHTTPSTTDIANQIVEYVNQHKRKFDFYFTFEYEQENKKFKVRMNCMPCYACVKECEHRVQQAQAAALERNSTTFDMQEAIAEAEKIVNVKFVYIGVPLCTKHTALLLHLKVKKSNIPNAGNGVFADMPTAPARTPVFKARDKICDYEGVIRNTGELNRLYGVHGNAPYCIMVKNGVYIDAASSRCIAAIINDPRGSRSAKANAEFSVNRKTQTITLVATRNIYHGQELYVDYGKDYWSSDNKNSIHETVSVKRD